MIDLQVLSDIRHQTSNIGTAKTDLAFGYHRSNIWVSRSIVQGLGVGGPYVRVTAGIAARELAGTRVDSKGRKHSCY
jgi:hypothetical protein